MVLDDLISNVQKYSKFVRVTPFCEKISLS
jgi:hypothetical protein